MALSMKDLEAQINELKAAFEALSAEHEALKSTVANMPKGRDRGPASEGDMTEEHAIRIMLGDLKDHSHKDAAIILKLSYGQIYSARKGYTFKKVYQRMIKGEIDDSCNQEIPNDSQAEEVEA